MPLPPLREILKTPTLAVLFGLIAATCLVGLRFVPNTPAGVPLYLAATGAAFVCYFAALLVLRDKTMKLRAAWVVVVAAAIQIAPLRHTPVFDRDAYRYSWDGKVLASGINPYQYAPGDHAIASLRDKNWLPIDYKDVHTIYPPLTEMLLAATYFLDHSPGRVMLLAVGFNLLSLLPLLLLLRMRGVDDKWLVVYAWNPMLAGEFGAAGHLDAIAIFFLLASLGALDLKRQWSAGSMIALAVMGKTQMLLAAPLILWRSGWRGLLAFVGVIVALAGPFVAAGPQNVIAGHLTYLQYWEANTGLFAVLSAVVGFAWAKVAVFAALLGLAAYLTLRPGDVALHVGLLMAAVLLIGPVFFPWYASWALPFASLFPTVTAPVATLLLLAPKLGLYGRELATSSRWVEFGLMYLCGIVEYVIWRRRRDARPVGAAGSTVPRKRPPQDGDSATKAHGLAGGMITHK